MRDPLLALLRVRSLSLDEARRIVGEALAAQGDAHDRLARAEQRLIDEARAAVALKGEDAAVEAYGRWLPVGQADRARCLAREREATAAVDRARAALVLARAACESVESLISERARAEDAARDRRVQHELDDLHASRRDREP